VLADIRLQPTAAGATMSRPEPVMQQDPKGILLLTGTLASGKTTVAIEVGRQLEGSGLACAVIDLDWLCWVHLGTASSLRSLDSLILTNLLSMWPNVRSVGVEYLVLARALIDPELLLGLAREFSQTSVTVVRLHASPQTIEERLTRRDAGENLDEHLQEVAAMTFAIEKLSLEHAIVINDGSCVTDVARRVLDIAAWV